MIENDTVYQFLLTQQDKFTFTVRALDGGNPALHADVEVELSVVNRNNKPPIWEHSSYGPIYIKENAQAGSDVISVRARLGEGHGGFPKREPGANSNT